MAEGMGYVITHRASLPLLLLAKMPRCHEVTSFQLDQGHPHVSNILSARIYIICMREHRTL